jgi:ribosome maturation factor RimP
MIDKIESSINGEILNLGFETEYVEFVKEGSQNILRIVIDKPNSNIGIDDCELVSRSIEDIVDKLISTEYVLEVSSPGVERQIKNIKLFKKYVGSEIYVKIFKKTELGKEFTGKLLSVDENEQKIIIIYNNKELELSLKDISSAHTVYDFNSVLKESKKENVNINKLNKFNK